MFELQYSVHYSGIKHENKRVIKIGNEFYKSNLEIFLGRGY